MWWNDLSASVLARRRLRVAGLLLAAAMAPVAPAAAQSGGVDELVQIFGGGAGGNGASAATSPATTTEPCVSTAGDELVLRAGKPCDLNRMATAIRTAVARHASMRGHVLASGCRVTEGCAGRRDNLTKLSHYSRNRQGPGQAASPRYYGQQD